MKKVLTDSFLRAAPPPPSGRCEISDLRCAGLTLRITPAGVRSFSYRFRDSASGRVCRATIGVYPAVGLSAARAQADAMRRSVAAGENPAERKRLDRATAGSKSFGALAARYLAEHARRKKRSHLADDRNLRKHILPRWQSRAYASIRRADVIELIEGLVAAGKPTLANRVHSLVSSIFTFALDADMVEFNPCARLRKRGVETVGRRVLGDAELRYFWDGIVELAAVRRTGLGLRLALLTGARVGEVAGLSRAELVNIEDPVRAMWIIPGKRTKNGRDHAIPLVPLAHSTILDALAMIEPAESFVFPTRSLRRSGPMRGNSFTQAMAFFAGRGTAAKDAAQSWRAEPPTPHDLRRTVATRLAELRIPKEIRDRVLNHIPSDIGSKHYNVHDYADEKRDALAVWSRALESILQPQQATTVVPMAAARARL